MRTWAVICVCQLESDTLVVVVALWLIVECQWVLGVYVLQQQEQEQQLNVCDVSVGGSSHVDNVGNFVMKSC